MEIQLKKELTKVLEDLHWLPLKPVQEKTIPLFLAGRNLLVQAETGAGKTAAYLLPLLQQTEPFRDENRALIIAPTRELAMQIRETADTLSSYLPLHTALLIGGIAPGAQEAELKRRPQIIIGTPGRIVYMIKESLLDLSSLKVLVIDEADMVVSTGQAEELRMIMQYIDHPVQTVCFSATVSDTVNSFIKDEYESVFLDEAAISHNVSSYYVICEDRYRTLLDILKQQDISAAIIFVKFRSETVSLAEKLQKEGYLAEAFSAYEDEKTRRQALERFRNGRTRLLVATDAASRGIDIRDLQKRQDKTSRGNRCGFPRHRYPGSLPYHPVSIATGRKHRHPPVRTQRPSGTAGNRHCPDSQRRSLFACCHRYHGRQRSPAAGQQQSQRSQQTARERKRTAGGCHFTAYQRRQRRQTAARGYRRCLFRDPPI